MINARTFGGWQKSATGNGVTDDTAALQAWLNEAVGGEAYLPAALPGKFYKTTAPLSIPVHVVIRGDGQESAIKAFHGGSVLQSLCTPNGSTDAGISLIDISIDVDAAYILQGQGFAQVSGSYVHVIRCRFGTFKRGIVFDQTEIATIESCIFGPSARGIWLVNDDEFTPGNLGGATNNITIDGRCQFDGCGYGICDDGGGLHIVRGHNFNACTTAAIYMAGVEAGSVDSIEVEGCPRSIIFSYLTATGNSGPGQSTNVTVGCGSPNFLNAGGGNAPILIVSAAQLTIANNIFSACNVGVQGANAAARIDEFNNTAGGSPWHTLDGRPTFGYVESWVGQPTAGFTNDYPTAAQLNAAIVALQPQFAPRPVPLPGDPVTAPNVVPWPHP